MPFYTYQATNSQGKSIKGSIQAESQGSAQDALQRQGFQRVSFVGKSATGVGPAAKRATVATPPAFAAAPSAARTAAPPAAPRQPQVAAPATPSAIRTKIGSHKTRYFLFTQLAAAIRSGIAPSAAMTDISARTQEPFPEALREIADRVTEGGSIADAMERYPDLFPPDVVGTTRAGETGGFLPEAFDEIARQNIAAHHFQRWFRWVYVLVVNAVLGLTFMQYAMNSLFDMWRYADKTGGVGQDYYAANRQIMWSRFLWPDGPIILAICLLLWLAKEIFMSRKATPLRHRLGLKLPILGPRARNEGYARLSWVLSRLSRAGLPHGTAYQLATDSVPNRELATDLQTAAKGMTERDRLSDIFARHRNFPEEYGATMATAEYTGDLPGGLDHLTQMSSADYIAKETYAKFRLGLMGWAVLIITGLLIAMILLKAWYVDLPKEVLSGLEPS
jgi:type II secretory pathway component PulF